MVNYFNRSRLERRSRTPVTPKTVYALGINNGAQNSGVRFRGREEVIASAEEVGLVAWIYQY